LPSEQGVGVASTVTRFMASAMVMSAFSVLEPLLLLRCSCLPNWPILQPFDRGHPSDHLRG
jgi:hypothetical protein